MTRPVHLDPTRKHDLVMLIEVVDGNPNGDPDAANAPRIDPETMQGLITDGAIKRRIRDYVDMTRGTEERFKIYVQNRVALNELHKRAYTALNLKVTGTKADPETVAKVQQWMCDNFFDIRTFGAVMTTAVNCGQVRGPVQFQRAVSIDPIQPVELAITRIAITRPEDMKIEVRDDGSVKGGKVTEMGRKWIVPYGLYRTYGTINPFMAQKTGFDAADLELLYDALINAWEFDRTASRGRISCRGLYVFTHEKPTGCAPAYKLHELIKVSRRPEVEVPRAFSDYGIHVERDNLPAGVTLTVLVEG